MRSAKLLELVSLATMVFAPAFAHTWIEEMQVISQNGTYIGDRGYSRGYVARTDPTFGSDGNILWMLPALAARGQNDVVRLRINSSDLLCHPNQRTANYSNPSYPKLKVAPGDFVAMKYLENGHTTLPWNQPGKPDQGGTVFIYGTTQPSATEKIADVLKWTTDGQGGDGRGFLMSAQTYDDSRCHQINNCVLSAERQVLFPNMIPSQPTSPGQEQWCESDVKIPSNQAVGSLAVYWIWQWPTADNVECVYPFGKDEYYTTCADFDIIDATTNNTNIAAEADIHTLVQENFQTTAVTDFQSRTALTTSPSVFLSEWTLTATPTVSLSSAFQSSCSIVISSAAAAAAAGETPALPPSCPAGKWATGALFASISSAVLAAQKNPAMATSSNSEKGYIVQAGATPVSGSMASSTPAATPTPTIAATTSSAAASYGVTSELVTVTLTQGITVSTTSTSVSMTTVTISVFPAPQSSSAAASDSGLSIISTVGTPPAGPSISAENPAPTTAAASSVASIESTTLPPVVPSATSPAPPAATSDDPLDVYAGPGGIIGEHPDNGMIGQKLRRKHWRHFR